MALKLRVISDHHRQLGSTRSRVFDAQGGRIGRAPDNDWVLPDPERYVSSHHASVAMRDGRWILEDLSTNGIFVNDANTPVSVDGPYQMRDGDRLRIGDYELLVSIEERYDSNSGQGEQKPPQSGRRKQAPTPAKRSAHQPSDEDTQDVDLGEELSITDLLSEDEVGSLAAHGHASQESMPARDRQSARVAPSATRSVDLTEFLEDVSAHAPLPDSGPTTKVAANWHMATRRQTLRESIATAPTPPPQQPAPTTQTMRVQTLAPTTQTMRVQTLRTETERSRRLTPATELVGDLTAVEAFCRGVGIDPASIVVDSHTALFTLAGQMLREVVLSLTESLKSRADQKDRFRVDKSGVQTQSNPLKVSSGVDDALRKLLDGRNTRYLGPVDALRDAFADLKNHQVAVDAAMQVALDDLLSRLAPAELQERFDRGIKRNSSLGADNKAKYWDLYTEFYPLLNQRDSRGFPAVFTEEFARVYGEKIAESENSKKK